MELDIQQELDAQSKKLEAIYISVEKTRKYFLIVTWMTVIVILLPAIGLIVALPAFINSYTSSFM
jgi:hypothetical protein